MTRTITRPLVLAFVTLCIPIVTEAQVDRAVDDGARAGKYGLSATAVNEAADVGEGRPALEAYETAARQAEARGDTALAIRAYAAAAFMARKLAAFPRVIANATRAIDLAARTPPQAIVARAVVSSHTVLGATYASLGDFEKAREVYERGLAFTRSGPGAPFPRSTAVAKTGLLGAAASLAYLRSDWDRARASVAEGEVVLKLANPPRPDPELLSISNMHTAGLEATRARVELATGKLDAAAVAIARAARAASATGQADRVASVAVLAAQVTLARGDAPGALKLVDAARGGLVRADNRSMLVEADSTAARIHEKLGSVDAALRAARSAITLLEDVRGELSDVSQRASFLELQQNIYQLAVRLALRGGNVGEAFALAERSRSRAFLDLLGSQTVLSKGRTRALAQEESRLRARIQEEATLAQDSKGATARLEAAEREYKAFLERVRKENGEQAALMSVEPVTLAEIQALLSEDTTLLEFLVGDDEIVLWIIGRRRIDVRRTPVSRTTLVADVREFRRAIATHAPLAEVETRARALSQSLIEPAREAIRGSRLVIVPHDVLHYVPFGALRTPDNRWLVDAFPLATVPSASVLKFLGGKGAGASDTVLAIGNPDLGPALALRYAEREARAIGGHFTSRATVLTRADASESRVKQSAPQAGLLHFAVHGELSEADPMGSALLLVPGQGEDGRLEVRELFGMELSARLVVLSACETGLGNLSRGDELVGLQRAFLYAGTPAVVTTLWKVDDRASFLLMRAFYDALRTKGASDALRAAQRAQMTVDPHPFAWAAFGLTGLVR